MTLPNDDIVQFLDGRFVLSHRNIEKDEHVGMSHGYKPTQSAVGTTNGAGPRNVQFLGPAQERAGAPRPVAGLRPMARDRAAEA